MGDSELIKNDIELLIISYLTGSISDEDLEALIRLLRDNDDNRRLFNMLKDSWIISGRMNPCSMANEEESWNRFRLKINNDESEPVTGAKKKVNYLKYLNLAASWILFFVLGSVAAWLISGRNAETKQENKTIEISTPLGAQSMIKMPDDTRIWLNAGTTITYNQDYGIKSRILNLNGEAYFNVTRDTLHPFVVNAESITVSAIGTRFNIKAYPDDKAIYTTLEEGRIDIRIMNSSGRNERIVLNPNEKFIYQKEITGGKQDKIISHKATDFPENVQIRQKRVQILNNVRTELETSWKDPRWIIDSEPLSTLAQKLERRFNLKIRFDDDQLMKYKFTGIIENETINQILDALKLTAPLDYDINKDTIKLFVNVHTREEFRKVISSKN